MVAIIDYDAGNIKSVQKAIEKLGGQACLSRDAKTLLEADHVILPGVGSFGEAMEKLKKYGLLPIITQIIERKIPFLGICLGMQLLFEESDESPGVKGLSILAGKVKRIPAKDKLKIPHIGWNSLDFPRQGRLFRGIKEEAYVYFVHSYYLQAKKEDIVVATTEYGRQLHVAVEAGNIFACQFHPEKSGEIGLSILKNFIEIERGDN